MRWGARRHLVHSKWAGVSRKASEGGDAKDSQGEPDFYHHLHTLPRTQHRVHWAEVCRFGLGLEGLARFWKLPALARRRGR